MKRPGTGMGHGAHVLPFPPFQTQDNHLSITTLLTPTRLGPGFRNLNTVFWEATTGQMGLDLETKCICNVLFRRNVNSQKRNLDIYIHSQSLLMSVKFGGKNPLGSSNLFGSLTPLMVSVSGHLIKILKVKSQIHPVLIFMDQ